jgi:hypothetical protein
VAQVLGEGFAWHSQVLEGAMHHVTAAAEKYAAGFGTCRDLVVANRAFSSSDVQAGVEAGHTGVPQLRQLLQTFHQQLADMHSIPATT